MTNVDKFWLWLSNDFLESFNAINTNVYRSKVVSDCGLFLNDAASVLVGFPILRQLRKKPSIFLFVFIDDFQLNPLYLYLP